jgi:hypothetical protein
MLMVLGRAGAQIDENPRDSKSAIIRALEVRHLIEQGCTRVIAHFMRTHGPFPLPWMMRSPGALRSFNSISVRITPSETWNISAVACLQRHPTKEKDEPLV